MTEIKKGSESNPLKAISIITGTPLKDLKKLLKKISGDESMSKLARRMANVLSLAEDMYLISPEIISEEQIKAVPKMNNTEFETFERHVFGITKHVLEATHRRLVGRAKIYE